MIHIGTIISSPPPPLETIRYIPMWHHIIIWDRRMVRTHHVKCSSLLVCSKDDGKTAEKIAYEEMEMGSVWALCDFSLLVSHQNYSNLSFNELDNELNRFYLKKVIVQEQQMLMSAKTIVDKQVAKSPNKLWEQKIKQIHTALAVLQYRAERLPQHNIGHFRWP